MDGEHGAPITHLSSLQPAGAGHPLCAQGGPPAVRAVIGAQAQAQQEYVEYVSHVPDWREEALSLGCPHLTAATAAMPEPEPQPAAELRGEAREVG
eukprot:COSAG01_NODE_51152_length_357_cov_0.616279_1_plen_95_part_10